MATERPLPEYFYWIFLALLSVLVVAVVYYITYPAGPGLGTDGIIYLSTAENWLKGKGFVDYSGQPLLRWPPLYPIILGALSWLTKLTTFMSAWHFNAALSCAMIGLGGFLLGRYFQVKSPWAYLGSLLLATSSSLLSLAVTVNTDLLFIILSWAFLICAGFYMQTRSAWSMAGMAILAAQAALVRLPGVALTITGCLLIVLVNHKSLACGIVISLLYALVCLLPLAAWIFFHNYIKYQVLLGTYILRPDYPFRNLVNSLVRIAHWFVSYNQVSVILAALLAVIVGLLILIRNNRQDWRRFGNQLIQPYIFPSLLFFGVYLFFIVMTANPLDTSYPDYDRYQVVLLPAVILLIFTAGRELIQPKIKPWLSEHLSRTTTFMLVAGVCLALLAYPTLKTIKYIRNSSRNGDIYYNLYNTPTLRNSQIVKFIRKIKVQKGETFYSNHPGAVWFYKHQDTYKSPRSDLYKQQTTKELVKVFEGWPGDQPGYLIWFWPNEASNAILPKDLEKIALLDRIYQGKDGEVYRVKARQP